MLYGPQKIQHRVKTALQPIFRDCLVNLQTRQGCHRLVTLAFEPPPSFWGVCVERDIWIYTALNKHTEQMSYVAEWDAPGEFKRADNTNLDEVIRSVANWVLQRKLTARFGE